MIYVEPARIKAMMAARKRELKRDHRTNAQFPQFKPGWTTKEYIFAYSCNVGIPPEFHRYADREAPYYTGPEVTVETLP